MHSRDKSFNIDDQVIILITDSTNKAFSKWQSPATVVEKCGPYSYIVELDGYRRQSHANMLRPLHTRVESLTCTSDSYTPLIIDSSDNTAYTYGCSIISDSNIAFGHLSAVLYNTAGRDVSTTI